MAENNFREIQGNSYRGSRYSNFIGSGVDAQGNVSDPTVEASTTAVQDQTGSNVSSIGNDLAAPTSTQDSQGITGDEPESPDLTKAALGAAGSYAANAIGANAGAAIGAGS